MHWHDALTLTYYEVQIELISLCRVLPLLKACKQLIVFEFWSRNYPLYRHYKLHSQTYELPDRLQVFRTNISIGRLRAPAALCARARGPARDRVRGPGRQRCHCIHQPLGLPARHLNALATHRSLPPRRYRGAQGEPATRRCRRC